MGVVPGAVVDREGANLPPGAVDGLGAPVTPFHGHIVSGGRCPIRFGAAGAKARESVGLVRLRTHWNFAHRRSTLAWSMKKSGSRAAVSMRRMKPDLKLICAEPCGLRSMMSKFA